MNKDDKKPEVVTGKVKVKLLGDENQFYNLAEPGKPEDIHAAGEVVEVESKFADQLIKNKLAEKAE